MFTKSSRLGLFYKPPALNSLPLFRETRTPFAARRWGLNRSLVLGAGGSPLPGKRQPGEASPVAPITLPARRSAPCRRRLPPRPGLPPGPACRHCCRARKRPPEKNPGAVIADGGAAGVSLLQLQKSPEGPPSRGAVTPDAAPMAEWGRRPSGAIVSLGAGKQEQGMGYGTWNTGGCVVVTPPCERTSNLSGETSI